MNGRSTSVGLPERVMYAEIHLKTGLWEMHPGASAANFFSSCRRLTPLSVSRESPVFSVGLNSGGTTAYQSSLVYEGRLFYLSQLLSIHPHLTFQEMIQYVQTT